MNDKELMKKAGYDEILQHRNECPKWGQGFCLECFGGGLTAWSKRIIRLAREDERKHILDKLEEFVVDNLHFWEGKEWKFVETYKSVFSKIMEIRSGERGGHISQTKDPDTAGSGNAGIVGKATTMPRTTPAKDLLLGLDWIKILQNAIQSRPEAWIPRGRTAYKPAEWRNASDTLMHMVIKELNKK